MSGMSRKMCGCMSLLLVNGIPLIYSLILRKPFDRRPVHGECADYAVIPLYSSGPDFIFVPFINATGFSPTLLWVILGIYLLSFFDFSSIHGFFFLKYTR